MKYEVRVTFRKCWGETKVDIWESDDLAEARKAAENSIKNRISSGLSTVIKIEEVTVPKSKVTKGHLT